MHKIELKSISDLYMLTNGEEASILGLKEKQCQNLYFTIYIIHEGMIQMNKRLRNILLGVVVLLWAGCIVVVITSFLKNPETYKDYPYAPTDIYSEGTVEEYRGMPMYTLAEIESIDTSDNLIVARSEFGRIYLSEDESWNYSQGVPSVTEENVKVFFVYLGWDEHCQGAYGYYLATISKEGTSTDLAAYSEVKGYYESRMYHENTAAVPEIVTLHGEFIYDTGNIYEAVGAHDYVFAGTVTAINGVEYPMSQSYTGNTGEEVAVSGPMFTSISVSVTEVIKGNLTAGEQIEAYKMGGYDGTEGVYYLLDSDVYPEVGQEYLFLANSDADGMCWLSAPKTVIPFASTDAMISTYSASEQSLVRQSVIDTYVDAYENEIPFSGEIYEDSVFPEAAVIED